MASGGRLDWGFGVVVDVNRTGKSGQRRELVGQSDLEVERSGFEVKRKDEVGSKGAVARGIKARKTDRRTMLGVSVVKLFSLIYITVSR